MIIACLIVFDAQENEAFWQQVMEDRRKLAEQQASVQVRLEAASSEMLSLKGHVAEGQAQLEVLTQQVKSKSAELDALRKEAAAQKAAIQKEAEELKASAFSWSRMPASQLDKLFHFGHWNVLTQCL